MEQEVTTTLFDLFTGLLGNPPSELEAYIYLIYIAILVFGIAEIFSLFRFIISAVFKWRT